MSTIASFLRRKNNVLVDTPLWNAPLPNQLTGVEVEVDQEDTVRTEFPDNFEPEWESKSDGSLRNGREYVLRAPLRGQSLADAVHKLYAEPTEVHRTYTGSTHIHLNMVDGTSYESLRVLLLLTYAFESVLYHVGDATRQWCGFANRLTSAPSDILEAILTTANISKFNQAVQRSGRYYGLNLAALGKYGTAEFRYFPTATSAAELLSWIALVQQFKKAAVEIGTVDALLSKLADKEGYNDFVETYFAEHKALVNDVCAYSKMRGLLSKALIIAASRPENVDGYHRSAIERFGKLSNKWAPKINSNPKVVVLGGDTAPSSANAAASSGQAVDDSIITVLAYGNGELYVLRRTGTRSTDFTWVWFGELYSAYPDLAYQVMAARDAILDAAIALRPQSTVGYARCFENMASAMPGILLTDVSADEPVDDPDFDLDDEDLDDEEESEEF